jgi:uncharacterized ubiquitin-like protein YukD
MDKLCVEVYVPGVNKSYDIMISPEMRVKAAAEYIFRTISEYEMLSLEDESCILCSRSSKRILDGALSLSECDIKDGTKLILV